MTLRRWDGEGFVAGSTLRRWDGATWQPPQADAFSPADIPNLHTWLDADAESPGALPVWHDSAGGHDYSIGGYFNPPTVVATGLGSHNVVRFNSAGPDALRWQGSGLTSDYHSFIVARMLPGAHFRLFGAIYPEAANFTAGWHGGNEAGFYNGSVFLNGGGQAVVNNAWRRCEMSGPANTVGYFNGVKWGESAGGASFNNGVALSGYGLTSTSELSDCEIALVLIYSRVLDSDERQAVDDYLVARFSL